MENADLRLDGNAAAGLLSEIFVGEMTSALGTCGSCGVTNALGSAQLYTQAPGAVLRCPNCTAILLCVTRMRQELLLDLSGLSRVRIVEAG
jgi:hypothetical protein